jgi:hypothetical protein
MNDVNGLSLMGEWYAPKMFSRRLMTYDYSFGILKLLMRIRVKAPYLNS